MAYLKIENLWKRFGNTIAVAGINLGIDQGEFVSLLGPSGCGKTTTLRLVAGLIAPESGEIWLQDQAITKTPVPMRGMGMVFQSWALFPNMTAVQNIGFPLKIRRIPYKRITSRVAEIVDLIGLHGLEGRFPHELSGGMRQRAMIAMALSTGPGLLIADEPTTALDVTIQAQILNLMAELKNELGMSVLFITHDMGLIAEMADRVLVMYAGEIVEECSVFDLFSSPRHPYTTGLLSSLPSASKSNGAKKRLRAIPGGVPDLKMLGEGCRFRDRCHLAEESCTKPQSLRESRRSHLVRCWKS